MKVLDRLRTIIMTVSKEDEASKYVFGQPTPHKHSLIEQQQRDLAKLQVEQQNLPPAPTPGKTGNCDKGVEATATKRGGDAYASGDMSRALGYYQDALTACPSSSKADMNLARVYETLDNRDAALRYYHAAASAKDSDGASATAANAALARLAEH